jgi:hypothetical protein
MERISAKITQQSLVLCFRVVYKYHFASFNFSIKTAQFHASRTDKQKTTSYLHLYNWTKRKEFPENFSFKVDSCETAIKTRALILPFDPDWTFQEFKNKNYR